MSEEVLVALITIVPTTIAVVVGFIQTGIRVDSSIDRVEADLTRRLDAIHHRLADVLAEQALIRERLARLEHHRDHGHLRTPVFRRYEQARGASSMQLTAAVALNRTDF